MSNIQAFPESIGNFIKSLPPEICREPEMYVIDGKVPLSAFRPLHIDQISQIIQFANQYNFAVSPQGSRTALTFGRKLERYDIALDTSGISKLVEYTPEDLTVTIESGATLHDLQAILSEHRQYCQLILILVMLLRSVACLQQLVQGLGGEMYLPLEILF